MAEDVVNAVGAADDSVAVRAFPAIRGGMLVGASLAILGLFLIGSPTSGAVTRISGFVIAIVGGIVFAL